MLGTGIQGEVEGIPYGVRLTIPSYSILPGRLALGLPTHSASLMAPGPEDPRALLFRGGVFVLFNLQFRNNDRRQVLYDHSARRLVTLTVAGMALQRAEKNWMPFVHEDALHFVYQLDPLVVLRCDERSGACDCVAPSPCRGGTEAFNTRRALARGGTPLAHVADGLFFGLVHSTFTLVADHAIRGHLVLFSTRQMGVVALSSAVPLPEALTACYADTVPWDVQFPSSVTLLGNTSSALLLLGVHVRDAMSSLLLLDLQEPLDKALRRVDAESCAELAQGGGGGGGACIRWRVLGDGAVDTTLQHALQAG